METAIWIIFALVLLCILYIIIRLIIKLVFFYVGWKRLRNIKRTDAKLAKRENYIKTTKNTNDERKRTRPTLERMNEEQIGAEPTTKIVGIKKPVGFWTNLVTNQILSQLDLNAFDPNQGFWVNFIKSQGAGRKRDDRGR